MTARVPVHPVALTVATAYAVATAAFIWRYLEAVLNSLCLGADVPCADARGASGWLTAGRWTAWLAGAALATAAVMLSRRARQDRAPVAWAWLAVAGTVVAGGVFSALVLTGPIAVP